MRGVALVVALAGCGRFSFDPLAGEPGDAAQGDDAPDGMIADAPSDDAAWMVKTAGVTSMGAIAGSITTTTIRASRVTLSEPALVIALFAHLDPGMAVASAGRVMLFSSVAGEPGTLVVTSEDLALGTVSPGWQRFPVDPPIALPSGDYWIANSINDPSVSYAYDDAAGAGRYGSGTYAAGPPSTFDNLGPVDRKFSMYVEYRAP